MSRFDSYDAAYRYCIIFAGIRASIWAAAIMAGRPFVDSADDCWILILEDGSGRIYSGVSVLSDF